MSELVLKFQQLNLTEQKTVLNFINFLLTQQTQTSKKTIPQNYKERILQVSVWSDEDMQVFDETKQQFNQWALHV